MPGQINEQDIFKICLEIIGKNTNGKISIKEKYQIILDLEHYPQRLDQLRNLLNQKFNLNLNGFISADKTPACTIMFLEKEC